MDKRTRIGLSLASAALLLTYFFPIWWIRLEAPQYPEGMGLHIWINKVDGQGANDLRTINGLNHYIGMKTIEPESIPELRIMPYVIGALIVLGLVAAMTGKRWMLALWLALFMGALMVGLVDFYLWEYDYGHNLNPHAPLKIPGTSFQPPLIGTKQILNMRTTSIPHIGGLVTGLAFLAGLWLYYKSWRQTKKESL